MVVPMIAMIQNNYTRFAMFRKNEISLIKAEDCHGHGILFGPLLQLDSESDTLYRALAFLNHGLWRRPGK